MLMHHIDLVVLHPQPMEWIDARSLSQIMFPSPASVVLPNSINSIPSLIGLLHRIRIRAVETPTDGPGTAGCTAPEDWLLCDLSRASVTRPPRRRWAGPTPERAGPRAVARKIYGKSDLPQ
jgi:hypothetical protein